MSTVQAPPGNMRPPATRSQHIVDGLAVTRRRPEDADTVVVLVHGAMDRAASFGRTMRRLGAVDVIAYDRRGYGGSIAKGPATSMADHVHDLWSVCEWATDDMTQAHAITAVGHSLGGLVVLEAAAEGDAASGSRRFASVGAFEAPLPWEPSVGGARPGDTSLAVARRDGPSAAAEYFYRAMVGDGVWNRLGDNARRDRLAEGPALVSDLEHSREPEAEPDLTAVLAEPHIACGERSSREMREAAGVWAERLAVVPEDIPGAGHGAHLSHPDEFARWVLSVAAVREH